jgi:type IV fimbrial biogenesis protein FimT
VGQPVHFPRKSGYGGFTLIEVTIAIVVLGIVVVLGMPEYQRLVVDSRMTTQANEFLTAIYYTRSEAVKRNDRVTMCKSSNGTSCATSGTWAQGWIVFTDGTTTGTVDAGDTVLRFHPALTNGSTLVGQTAVASYVSYGSSGQTTQSGRFDLCASPATYPGRDITVAATTGRPSITNDGPTPVCNGS